MLLRVLSLICIKHDVIYEQDRMVMMQNVNNDVTKDVPIDKLWVH